MNGDQRGFTLIELALVIVVTSIIMAALTASILQVINGTALSNNRMTVVNNVRSAGDFISRDARMADNATPSSGFPLTLTWEDFCTAPCTPLQHTVVYTYSPGPPGCQPKTPGCQTIPRAYDTDPPVTIAHYIATTPTQTNNAKIITLTITATTGSGTQQDSESRTYIIRLRNGP
ncbi:MAG: prepilin-type N-terminal cleavage/methylation domain-containing protein [Patescibacteria group bacterium]